jgi:hypothetical protein
MARLKRTLLALGIAALIGYASRVLGAKIKHIENQCFVRA